MQPIRVLLVDDDPDYHALTSRMLARTDQTFVLDWVGSYQEGLEVMLKREHDIYLLDYNLGQMSGLELLKQAQTHGIDAPIIMMTGQGHQGVDLEALQAGAMDYIDKVELKPTALQRSIRYSMERAHITQQLRENEELYRSLIEEAFDAIVLTKLDGTITLVNNRFCELMHTTADSLINTPIQGYIGQDHDLLSILTEQGTVFERLLYPIDSQDGIDVEISAKRIGQRLQFIIRDITGRKESIKERDQYIQQLTILRQVDSELSEVLDMDYVMSMALDAAVRLSGADAGCIGLIENNRILVKEAIGHFNDALEDGYLRDIPLVRHILNDNTPRLIQNVDEEPDYVQLHEKTRAQMLLPLMSYERMVGLLNLETSKPERFTKDIFEFLQLVTARVAVALENAQLYQIVQDRFAELERLYVQVSHLEQIKTDMIRIAAHDLRNPVSVILGYAELLEGMVDDTMPERFKKYISMIETAARRMQKITTDILSLERIENLQTQELSPADLTSLVAEIYSDFEGQALLKSQKLHLETVDTPLMVLGDPTQLHEAMANLLSNAVKYTQERGDITIKLEKNGEFAEFRVIDNGFGIPENMQFQLFQPFYRAKTDETKDVEGTGLGLYLIKSIIERYGGNIIFQSKYGKGSTFGFSLPLASE